MSNHVTEWLNAYFDGELRGRKLHEVEEHLADCETCQAELDALYGLSAMLQNDPIPEALSNERFISQVNLRLPQRVVKTPQNTVMEIGWWMVPVAVLMLWIFLGTTSIVSDMVSVAKNFGVLDQTTASFVASPSEAEPWTATMGQVGVLQGNSLQWAEQSESYTRNVLPQFIWQVALALLYLAWIATWWARHTRQVHGQLLEG